MPHAGWGADDLKALDTVLTRTKSYCATNTERSAVDGLVALSDGLDNSWRENPERNHLWQRKAELVIAEPAEVAGQVDIVEQLDEVASADPPDGFGRRLDR
jgi:hypothetical protein